MCMCADISSTQPFLTGRVVKCFPHESTPAQARRAKEILAWMFDRNHTPSTRAPDHQSLVFAYLVVLKECCCSTVLLVQQDQLMVGQDLWERGNESAQRSETQICICKYTQLVNTHTETCNGMHIGRLLPAESTPTGHHPNSAEEEGHSRGLLCRRELDDEIQCRHCSARIQVPAHNYTLKRFGTL